MPETAFIVLAAVAVLMVKHAVADFYLQTPYQYLNKGHLRTSGRHDCTARSTWRSRRLFICCSRPPRLLVAFAVAVGEFLVHYHIDWLKEQATRRNGLTPQNRASGTCSAPTSSCTG